MKPIFRVACDLILFVLTASSTLLRAQPSAAPDLSSLAAHRSPEKLKSGGIYQVFVCSFSPPGDLPGVTAPLNDLHDLNVNIAWLMPIHPSRQRKNSRQDQP